MKISLIVISLVFVLMLVAIALDVPGLRQIISFVFLSFVPGLVVVKVLKLRDSNVLDTVLFSAGLSVVCLMFVGLLINEFLPVIGILHPLSTVPVVLAIGGMTMSLYAVAFRQNQSSTVKLVSSEGTGRFTFIQALPVIFLPFLSIFTAIYAKGFVSLLIVVIAILILAVMISTRILPVKIYPLLIFSISISLTLQFTLMSTHVMGADSPLEYYVYKLTSINERWVPLDFGVGPRSAYNSMLSITILPTVYSKLLNIDGELTFKVLYPFLFSLVPLTIYRILAKENWSLGALLSALFFVSSPIVFYGVDPLSLNRQIVGEFFFLLSVLLLVERPFSSRNNRLIFIVFGVALALSHYALMFIYLVFLVSVFAYERIRDKADTLLNGGVLLVLFGVAFFWYAVTPSNIITSLSNSVDFIISRFVWDFGSGGATAPDIFSAHPVPGIASAINWTLFYFVHFLILIGIIAVIFNVQDKKLDSRHRMIIILSSVLLFLAVVVPNFAPTLNFTRYYAIAFLFLAPCFVFGGKLLFRVSKRIMIRLTKYHFVKAGHMDIAILLIGIVAIAYFLAQSGFVNYISGGSTISYALGWDKISSSTDPAVNTNFYIYFTPEQDVASATWLSMFMEDNSLIYSDWVSIAHPLRIYGMISDESLSTLTIGTQMGTNSYVYLRYFNIADRVITPTVDSVFNITDISSALSESNLEYSNGKSNVYASQLP